MKREELSEISLGGSVGSDCLYYGKREADEVMDALEYDIRIYQDIVAKAEARIKELEASQPKWISVEDRLPDPSDGLFLVTYENGVNDLCIIGSSNHFYSTSDISRIPVDEEITHWMSLINLPSIDNQMTIK